MILPKSSILNGILVPAAAITLTSIMAYRMVLYPESNLWPFLFVTMAVAFIVWRPIIGIATYLFIYPGVPEAESINLLKMGMLGLTALNFFIWLWQKLRVRNREWDKPEYIAIYVFLFYLLFSILLGISNGFSVLEWARDISALVNLIMIPVLADYFKEKKHRWLIYVLAILIGIGMVQSVLYYMARYNFVPKAMGMYIYPYQVRITGLHIPILLLLGACLIKYRTNLWLTAIATICLCLAYALFTITRTIWLSVAFTGTLYLAYFTRFRRTGKALVLMMCTILAAYYIFTPKDTFSTRMTTTRTTVRDTQMRRLRGIMEGDVSLLSRLDESIKAWDKFKENPIYGVGFGYSYYFWAHHVFGKGSSGFYRSNYIHNDILYILSKGGLVGLILFAAILHHLLSRLQRLRKRLATERQNIIPTIAICSIYISLYIGNSTPVIQARSGMFFLVVMIALGMSGFQVEGHKDNAAC